MKNQDTILARYAKLSHDVCQAELLVKETADDSPMIQSNALDCLQSALDSFWAFVDKYVYNIPVSVLRQYEKENSIQFTVFC